MNNQFSILRKEKEVVNEYDFMMFGYVIKIIKEKSNIIKIN